MEWGVESGGWKGKGGGRMTGGGRGGAGRGEGGKGKKKKKKEGQGRVRWPSCVLAVGSRRLIGVGQVRVGLSAGDAVQLGLDVAQAQFGTCNGKASTEK